ncbi:MAG: hypothetical protein M1817_003059 [Caeruleum heppii]|nr:MAG: hypothetical protein M1817_003059 [Caeruleum heppii]
MSISTSSREPHVIFLTGAPLSKSLSWDDSSLELTRGSPHSSTAPLDDTSLRSIPPSTTKDLPPWRIVPLRRQHLPSGLTQTADPLWIAATWVGRGKLEGDSIDEEVLSQFYDDSLALHESFDGTQTDPEGGRQAAIGHAHTKGTDGDDATDVSIHTSSCDSTFLSTLSPSSTTPPLPAADALSILSSLHPTIRLTSVSSLPSASHVTTRYPQTTIVNLLVGIISLPPWPLREIPTRGGKKMHIFEMIVGDETRAGFGVNLWLPPDTSEEETSLAHKQPRPPSCLLRQLLRTLRLRDVILLRNVALSSFRGAVYAQSLRGDFTKVHVLQRDGQQTSRGRSDSGDHHPAVSERLAKMERVVDWVERFLGASGRVDGRRAGAEALPPDTQ